MRLIIAIACTKGRSSNATWVCPLSKGASHLLQKHLQLLMTACLQMHFSTFLLKKLAVGLWAQSAEGMPLAKAL